MKISALFLSLGLCFISQVNACDDEAEPLVVYTAKLGVQDHFNSKGTRLQDVAAIIRQDRANFHKFGKADKQDEWDSFFNSKKNRALLEKMLRNSKHSKRAYNKIINSTPIITVYIYDDRIEVHLKD